MRKRILAILSSFRVFRYFRLFRVLSFLIVTHPCFTRLHLRVNLSAASHRLRQIVRRLLENSAHATRIRNRSRRAARYMTVACSNSWTRVLNATNRSYSRANQPMRKSLG
jgi:hypothetical protein